MATTARFGFRTLANDEVQVNWHHVVNNDIDRLNNSFLKLQALYDVDVSKLKDGSILLYNTGTQKWECKAV